MMQKIAQVLFFACLVMGLTFLTPLTAQQLDLPILEKADSNLDTCALGQVTGLKKSGDGFLAVRTGPGGSYTKIDELHNGDNVWVFSGVGEWMGVIYGVKELDCSPILKNRAAPQQGKKGWIHSKWVEIIAG